LFGPFSPNMKEINQDKFIAVLKQGDISKYTVVSNRSVVRVTLKPESMPKYEAELKKTGKMSKDGPHMYFKIVSGDSFQDDMRKFYSENPTVTNVGLAGTEKDFFGGALQFLLPILLFVGIWILLMRKMSGGAGGGGGPGGIFNIGKSKATLFDKGTKVNITFADVAGLDEAKVEVMEIVVRFRTEHC
jgi:AFG3 family protein